MTSTMRVYVVRKEHANMDSMPFRFGVHLKRDTILELFDVSDRKADLRNSDRFHVNASFRDPESPEGPAHRGHFVLLEANAIPKVVTVWRTDDAETETYLSELIRNLRRDGILSVNDLLALNPEHVSGRLRTASQLFERLLLDRTHANRRQLEATAENAHNVAEKLLAEVAEAKRVANEATELAKKEAVARVVAESKRSEAEINASTAQTKVEELNAIVEGLQQQLQDERRRANDDGNALVVNEPDTLVRVNERVLYRGSACTELVMGDGSRLYMKTNRFDPQGKVTEKAKTLVMQRVRTTCWDPHNEPGKWSRQGYFRNIYLAPN